MADVFLSYNREDQATAKMIAEALEADGFEVWWDTVLRAGQTYDEVTERQLRDAWAVVVLWSSRSVRSKWVRAEATLGDRKAALIPVMIEPCERPIMFELIQTADLTQWNGDLADSNWLAFIADVREHVERKRSAGPVAAPQPPSTPAAQGASTESVETAFWMSVKDGDDAGDFRDYLERYPNGHFAKLARKRLEALRAPPPKAPAPAAAQALPRPQPAAAAPSAPRKRAKSSNLNMIFAGIAVLAAAAAAFTLWPRSQAQAPASAQADAPATPPEPAAPAPATATAPAVSASQTIFRDCPDCPEMARLAGGAFMMGSPESELGRRGWEGPQHNVQVPAFAIGVREVTFAEWDACVADGGCGRYTPTDRGWGRGARPVLMVSWSDAQAYVRWLSGRSGRAYRLPSEAEWEFAARGGSTTAYWWGDRYDAAQIARSQTSETGAHAANGFGLFDVTGNVAEWVEDCYINGFTDAPVDGGPMLQGNCAQRVVRGGSWRDTAQDFRIANRSRISRTTRDGGVGFRVAASP